jgi:hypothetical protein
MKPVPSAIVAAAALGASFPVHGVYLNTNGTGQALIYPYYTVRTAGGGNAFNTYLTVVNTATSAKAVRVRLREGRAGRPVLDFNLYLSPNDVWASAVVPTADGAQLITTDTSCTDPAFSTGTGSTFLPLNANGYTGTNADGFGDTLDRTREGYVEMLEMATLTGLSAQAVTHNSAGIPSNCAAIRTTAVTTAPPGGGLSGTLTLINVNSGQDFTLDATALDNLASRAYFRPPSNAVPVDFSANEIDPVSVVVAGGHVYRSTWTRPQDAVSAVLMRSSWAGEYILDIGTRSLTDVVTTMPTRHYYVSGTGFEPPFTASGAWNMFCAGTGPGEAPPGLGQRLAVLYFNRDEQGAAMSGSGFISYPRPYLCAAAAVGSVRNAATHMPEDHSRSAVLGSTTGGLALYSIGGFQNGWLDFVPEGPLPGLASLPGSTRTEIAGGQVTTGSHLHRGLPVIGFTVRTFSNGTLTCTGAGSCQGNYGGAFGLKYRRTISP